MPRMSHVRMVSKTAAVLLALGSVLLNGCSEDSSSGFQEILPQTTPVAVFDDLIMSGGQWTADYFEITGEMVHPEVRSNWTVLNREVFIDMYLFRASDYDENLPPDQQMDKVFWSSVPVDGPEFGDRRGTQVILHPCVYNTEKTRCRPEGRWVIVFYNNNEAILAKRTELSATVVLRFFQ